jgi:hypothetical protein
MLRQLSQISHKISARELEQLFASIFSIHSAIFGLETVAFRLNKSFFAFLTPTSR